VAKRQCAFRKPDGSLCHAPPLRDGKFCLFHDPEHAAEATEAQRLGGLRRRREVTVAGAYDFEGLDSIPRIRRLLEVAVIDVLSGAEGAIPRARAIIGLALAAERLLRTGELEDRIEELEAAITAHRDEHSAFEEPDELSDRFALPGDGA
jgi:hypothetical protein